MEVGQVIWLDAPPAPLPKSSGTYRVPVRIQGSIDQAMVDSGYMQTLISEDLVQLAAKMQEWVEVRCVHGDVHRHHVRAVVSSHLTQPLISGTD